MANSKWDTLSMIDRAELIRLGVQSGLRNLNDIREAYNTYGEGGGLNIPDKWKPWYWGKKEYDAPTLKEAIEKAYDDGKGGETIIWNGKAYKAELNDDDTRDYLIKKTIARGYENRNSDQGISRVRRNDSPTRKGSEEIEDDIARRHNAFIEKEKKLGVNSKDYYIPYIEDKEVTIPKVGRVSSNVLDSIYVNAQRAGIPFQEGLGLATEETKLGAAPNSSTAAYISKFEKSNGRKPTNEEIKEHERELLNSSYARNFGGIYPQFLINDHEWFQRGWEESKKYKEKLHDIKSPLEHGFTLYKMGLYNTGMDSHTDRVKKEGERIVNTPVVKKWMKENEHKYKKK